ncbi:hypothetical protein [Ramlibacter sp.]|uniref:hypothetical protein n=1 Tax=Ramlibacter sp. TaxID=1917967 RepID=UPI0017E26ED2|nr:hypothetical protein [Ramlibacter sp.]MBA2672625.1 hypothetical protein [Ramlibacter sp.]
MKSVQQMHTSRFISLRTLMVLAAGAVLVSVQARAASIEAAEYDRLVQSASANGFVPVLVTLEHLSLSTIQAKRPDVISALTAKLGSLQRELGSSVLEGGSWNNGMGQVGFYVNQTGLQALRRSTTALSFTFDASVVRASVLYLS